MTIFCLLCVFVMCVLEADCVVPFSSVGCTKTPDCPLFNLGSDIVTLENLQQELENGVWAMIYYFEPASKQTFGKCNFKWDAPDENNVFRRQTVCFNFGTQECNYFERNLTRKLDDCGRAEENAVNSVLDTKFYSQDALQYLWYDACSAFNDDNECTSRFLDLLVRKSRVMIEPPMYKTVSPSDRSQTSQEYTPARQYRYRTVPQQVLDLQSLPWDLISVDLKNIFDIDIGSDFMKFTWMGPECGFDGKVIQGPYTFY